MELTQVKQLKLNVSNINSFLKKSNKNYNAIKKSNQRIISQQVKQDKLKSKERGIEKKSTLGSSLKTIKDVATPSEGILGKLFNFGGILLTGILLNALPSIKARIDKFIEDNKELFDTIGGFLTGVKDAAVGLFNSFTGPESEKGAFDGFAKFGEDGKLLDAPEGGALSEFVKVISDLAPIVEKINDATKNPIVRALERTGYIPERSLMDRAKEFVTGKGAGQLDNYEGRNSTQSQTNQPATTPSEFDNNKDKPSTGPMDPAHGAGSNSPQSKTGFVSGNGNTNRKIFLHWSAGSHTNAYDAYHSIALGDGSIVRHTPYDQNKYAHTAKANTGSVGLAIAAMGGEGVGENNFGAYPPTKKQLDAMVYEAARLAVDWGWSEATVDSNVRTHGEWERYATRNNILSGRPQRWDVDKLRQSDPNVDTSKILSGGGNELRERIKATFRLIKQQQQKLKNATSTSITPASTPVAAQISRPSNNNNRLASLNSSMGEDGSITYIYAVQPVIT